VSGLLRELLEEFRLAGIADAQFGAQNLCVGT
jgi:hypothetical protein